MLVTKHGYRRQVTGMQDQHPFPMIGDLKENFLAVSFGGDVAVDAEINFAVPGGGMFENPLFQWGLAVITFHDIPAPGYIIEQSFLFFKGEL